MRPAPSRDLGPVALPRAPRSLLRLLVAFGALAIPSAAAAEEAAPDPLLEQLRAQTGYDAAAPLETTEVSRTPRQGGTLVALTYRGAEGKVPAYLVLPSGQGPFPAVLFLHSGQSDKSEFVDEALQLARSGVVSLLIDAPFVRPEPDRKPLTGPQTGAMFRQTLIDLRRGLDLLSARPEVDRARLGFVGHSFGASLGGALSGIEPRVKALVLIAGTGDLSRTLATAKKHPEVGSPSRHGTPMHASSGSVASLESLAPYDGIVGVRVSGARKLFFQFAREDEYVSFEQATRFHVAAAEPKLFRFYAAGHGLTPNARTDRLQWLQLELGFAPIADNGTPRILPLKGFDDAPPFEVGKLRPFHDVGGMTEVEVLKDLVYSTAGGRSRTLDLYLPPVAKRRTVPLVVLVHGVAHPAILSHLKDTPLYEWQARALAATGLVVAVPSNGSPSTGADPSQWYENAAAVEANLFAAIDYLRANAGAHRLDADRICLFGFSAAGTYGLARALSAPPPWLRCVVAWYPLLEGPVKKLPREVAPLEQVKRASAKSPPWFLVRSGKDDPALLASLDAFVAAAKQRKLPLTVRSLPLAHHAFDVLDDAEDSRAVIRETAAFLNGQLGP